jgi:heme/copper-type cytochrome/quinol oxidase subunit 2
MAERFRHMLGGPASLLLVLVMLAGCLFLWVGVPLGWLWIGSQVQSSASLGAALAVTMAGVVATIVLIVIALAQINGWHAALQERRSGHLPPNSALEVTLVSSAGLAVVGFAIWFFGFAGASPVPLNIGF